jgi:hypothetical protein
MTEVFIENQRADVSDVFSTLISYSINDIKDFSASSTAVSKTVIMPGTNINNKLFGSIFNVSVSNPYDPSEKNIGINFNAAISAQVIVFQDNFQVLKGTMQLLEITIDNGFIEYEVAFFGELSGFVSKMGAKKLEDLDFSSYNEIYSLFYIENSWANIGTGSGVVYPLIDYGVVSTNKHDFDIRAFRPAFHEKEYVDKIFSSAGYTYECDVFNTALYKTKIIPHNQKTLTGLGNLVARANVNSTTIDSATAKNYTIPFDTLPTSTGFTLVAGILTYTGATTYLNFKVFVSGTKDFSNNVNFELLINGSSVKSRLITVSPFDFIVSAPNILVNAGDVFSLKISYSGAAVIGGNFDIYSISLTARTLVDVVVNINPGDMVQMNYCIPKNILQKDFISSILKMYNMYVFEDKNIDKTLFIKPFVDFYAGADTIDWTLKIDRSKPLKLKPMSELNSRYYQFSYKEDSDYWNDLYKKRFNLDYGGYIYDSQYEFAKETNKVEVVFSGTPILGYVGEDKVYSTIFKRNGPDSSPTEENIDSNIRTLYCTMITGISSWSVYDGASFIGAYTKYPYAGHFDNPFSATTDLNFGVLKEYFFTLSGGVLNNNMFNLYWSTLMAEITDKDSKMLTAMFKLSKNDIYNIDFSKLVYVDGSLFRLNKINDYNANREDVCQVELLKVINKIY